MTGKHLREALRRMDVGCAQRARWLGLRRRDGASDSEKAEEQRRRVMENARQMLHRPGGFNQR